ncbi:MAG TPA: thioredoxin family protein [Opitutaceae bacterium]
MTSLRLLCILVAASLLAPVPLALAADPLVKAPEPVTISHGKKVQLSDYLVPGKTTVFDFYSENCPTCKAMAPGVRKLHEARGDIAVVFVDINRPGAKGIDWDSPVSIQYNLPSTPQFKVYGPDGKLKAEGKPAFAMVSGWLD